MKMTVKQTRKPETKPPAMPSTAEIASGTAAETCSDPACTFSAAPLSPSQESSSDCAQLLDGRGQLLEEVADPADERHQEQQRDHQHRDGGAEHRDRRGQPARHAGLRHHVPHRILEHERQEDPDEHEQEGVADRPERREHAYRRRDEQHGPHRQDSSTRRGARRRSATSAPVGRERWTLIGSAGTMGAPERALHTDGMNRCERRSGAASLSEVGQAASIRSSRSSSRRSCSAVEDPSRRGLLEPGAGDERARDRGGDDRQEADPEQHHGCSDEPSGDRLRDVVPVADRRRRLGRPTRAQTRSSDSSRGRRWSSRYRRRR